MAAGDVSERVTQLLVDWGEGDPGALERLAEAVYPELRRIAAARLGRESPGHTLQPTALANEAFLRLMQLCRMEWKNRDQLYALATTFMRRILVEHARKAGAAKRGGRALHVTLHDHHRISPAPDADLVEVDVLLGKLAALHPRRAQVVELRCFGGMTVDEVASALGSSRTTVEREWRFACTWLRREMHRGGGGGAGR